MPGEGDAAAAPPGDGVPAKGDCPGAIVALSGASIFCSFLTWIAVPTMSPTASPTRKIIPIIRKILYGVITLLPEPDFFR
jgi:hypothetical protein